MEKLQKKTYSDVQSAFENHEILQSSKADLEQFLLAIAMTRVLDPANQMRTTEMGDTIRLLLAARQSQQMHSQSSKVSCIALVISVAALICSGTQAYYAKVGHDAARSHANITATVHEVSTNN
jgi:hypothetical protein